MEVLKELNEVSHGKYDISILNSEEVENLLDDACILTTIIF